MDRVIRVASCLMLSVVLHWPEVRAQELADTPTNRAALAKDVLGVQPITKLLDDSIVQFAQSWPDQQRAEAIEMMMGMVDRAALMETAVQAIAETFTVAEMEAMIGFWGSPVGRSIQQKYPQYMAAVMPMALALVMDAGRRVREAQTQ